MKHRRSVPASCFVHAASAGPGAPPVNDHTCTTPLVQPHGRGLTRAADGPVDHAVKGRRSGVPGCETPTACLTKCVSSVADVRVVAPLNDARSGSMYTSGSPMSAQLLHTGTSTQYAWNGSVNSALESHRGADDVGDGSLSQDGVVHHTRIGRPRRRHAGRQRHGEREPTRPAAAAARRMG